MMHVDGHDIELSNTDKLLFPQDGVTKGDVIDYYHRIAPQLLPHVEGRPLTLQRFPDGLDKEGFYQQQAGEHFPDWIHTHKLPRAETDERVDHILCDDTATLVYLANQGTLSLHRWLARTPRYTRPDCLIFDLDPPGDDFTPVRDAARRIMDLMNDLKLSPFIMTTGSRGLHVVAPLKQNADFDQVRALARGMAEHLARENAETLTLEQRKDKRRGRLYLDITRNAYGQTAVAPYSLRARAGAPIATPLSPDEIDHADLGPRDYHIGNIFRRLARVDDPWEDIRRHAVDPDSLQERLKKLSNTDNA